MPNILVTKGAGSQPLAKGFQGDPVIISFVDGSAVDPAQFEEVQLAVTGATVQTATKDGVTAVVSSMPASKTGSWEVRTKKGTTWITWGVGPWEVVAGVATTTTPTHLLNVVTDAQADA